MVPHTDRRGSRRRASIPAVLTALAVVALVSACDKVPLLAPSGSVITLFPAAPSVTATGETDIVAVVIENGTATTGTGTGTTTTTTSTKGAGTPVQNGTLVTFTTTIGRIEPREARTHNGEVRVRFYADGQTGTAKITAYSGGAVATIDNFAVGAERTPDHLIVTASPQTVPSSGGSSTIEARVESTTGVGVPGALVTFSTTKGTLSQTSATTDANGVARTVLTTSAEAVVTASATGGTGTGAGVKTGTVTVRVNSSIGLTVTSSPEAPVAGQRVTFTITTASGSGTITDATIDFGDGEQRPLGSQRTATHTYDEPGRYTVVVTARDANGETGTAITEVSVGALPASLTASPTSPKINENTELTVTGVPSTVSVREYRWDFGDGTQGYSTTTNNTQHQFPRVGTFVVRADVIGVDGSVLASPQRQVVVTAAAAAIR